MLAAFDVTLLTIFVLCSTQLLRPKGEKKGPSGSSWGLVSFVTWRHDKGRHLTSTRRIPG